MIKPVWNPFSRYADKQEKRVDKILKKVAFLGVFEAQRKILDMMQANLVILDLWLEARFKGYKYLTRSMRKKLYRNSEKTARIFLEFAQKLQLDDAAIGRELEALGLSRPQTPGDDEKLRFLVAIMLFLRPGTGRYEYLEGASFGKLLGDLEKNQHLIGDCNQIVTFYAYLFSLKYQLKDLQIKILEEHVCLHFKGIDIEATAGGFANYKKYLKILPVVELISTNLLDVSDFRDKQIKVNPRDFLKAAQLANHLSSERDLVTHNLKIGYHNVAVESLEQDDFDTALFFLKTAGIDTEEDRKFEANILHNAVVHHARKHDFRKARFYAEKSGESDLKRYIDEQEAFDLYRKNSLSRARELFSRAGNQQMVKSCYAKEYNQIQSRVAGLKTVSAMRPHRGDFNKMLDLARKMGDPGLEENVRNILNQL